MMVRVKVRLVQEFYQYMKKHEIEIELPGETATIAEVLEKLPGEIRERLLDDKGRIKPPAEVAVNGRRIEFLQGLETRVKEGDVVLVSPRALFVV